MKLVFFIFFLAIGASAATYDYPVKTSMNPPTANRVATTDSTGKLNVPNVTTNELGYVSGVTSAIQTQLNAKGAATNGTFSGGTFTTATNSGATYFGTAWVTNDATQTQHIMVNSNLTALGALRVGPSSAGWTLNAGDAAVQQQLYVGGAGVNSGYMAAFNIQSGTLVSSPGEITFDARDGVARTMLFTWRANGTRVGYVGWSGSSSTNNRVMVFNEDHGDGMTFQIGTGGGQNGWRWYGGANARYQMKLHPDVGGLAIGSSFYSTAPKTNGLNIEGKVGMATSNPQYGLDVNDVVRITGSNKHWFGGTSGVADADAAIHRSAAGMLTATTNLTVVGSITTGTQTKTGNYTLLEGDGGVTFVDATGGAVTITLPAASSSTIGRMYRVFKVDSSGNAVNIAPNGSNTLLAGSTTNTTAQANCLNVTGYSATAWIVNKTQ